MAEDNPANLPPAPDSRLRHPVVLTAEQSRINDRVLGITAKERQRIDAVVAARMARAKQAVVAPTVPGTAEVPSPADTQPTETIQPDLLGRVRRFFSKP